MSGLTNENLKSIAIHIGAFVGAYAVCMATGNHAEFFNWACLANALVAVGATNLGAYRINTPAPVLATVTPATALVSAPVQVLTPVTAPVAVVTPETPKA